MKFAALAIPLFTLVIAWSPFFSATAFARTVCVVMPQEKTKASSSQTESVEVLEKRYLDSIDELRAAIKVLRRHEITFFHVDSEASFEVKEKWEKAAEISNEINARAKENAIAFFLATDKPDKDLSLAIRDINKKLFANGELGRSYELTKKLYSLSPDDPQIQSDMARVAILSNDFEYARKFLQTNRSTIEKFSGKEQVLFSKLNELIPDYKRELELQEKDKTANLPRVEMTILGKEDTPIIIELFEDEAPETVANFISLIETGIYDGIIFHRVARAYMSHGGKMSMNKLEPIGYTIYDESQRPDKRHHFRGTLATWSDGVAPNSCGAEFTIMNVPGPHLTDSNHTVFGRVISGMRVVDSFQPTMTLNEEERKEEPILDITPETIKSLKIIRKRDHVYEPNRVQK